MRNKQRLYKPACQMLAGITIALLSPLMGETSPLAAKPNIIFIMADDLGYGDVGFNGQDKIRTPSLDRMAAEGLVLNQHYAGSTVCMPSRCSLMTGMHMGRATVRGNPRWTATGVAVDLGPDDVTVAEELKRAGYTTGIIGKWGLAEATDAGMPLQQGFDFFYGYRKHVDAHYYYWPDLWEQDQMVHLPGNDYMNTEGDYTHDLFKDRAMEFISNNKEGPFFLYLALTIPHYELTVPEEEKEPYKNLGWPENPMKPAHYRHDPEGNVTYAGMVSRMDRDIGGILDQLKSLGIADNTLVIFTSDNGPEYEKKDRFFNSNGALRGGKRDLYEGGIRVPFVAWWPGRIEAGVRSDHISAFDDFLPTACELAGVTPSADVTGISYLPTLLGNDGCQEKREYIYWEFNEGQGPIQAIRAGKWKGVQFKDKPLQLFNLEEDISETHDLTAEQPEIAARVQSMLIEARVPHPAFPLKKVQRKRAPITSYYIDAENGNDRHAGLSEDAAWKSLKKVNATTFQPGDQILFRSGSVWKGQLVPKGNGISGRPIVIDRYGEGDLPVIHGRGRKESTLLLENVQYWEVNNLEITNKGFSRSGGRRGVVVRAMDMGECHHIHLKNLVVHDVNGSLVKKEKGGSAIMIENGGRSVPTRFVDILIEGCHLYKTERNGINFRGNSRRTSWYPNLNVVVRNNLLEQIPGDGIVVVGCDGALVEHNVMRDCPDTLPFGDAAAGIWPWSSDNTIIQFNEVSGHNAKWDGQGFDADFNCIGTVIQYNYSHDNAGGFLLICNKGETIGGDGNIGTENTIIRYNVSINDGIREYPTESAGWFTPAIHITGPVKNTQIYNNLIILPEKKMEEIDSTAVIFRNWGGPWPENTLIANNIFISPKSTGFIPGKDEGTLYSNNCYFGDFETLPDDAAAILSDPLLANADARGEGFAIMKQFLLQKGSPCIGNGIPIADGLQDILGNIVPSGGPVNIGVSE